MALVPKKDEGLMQGGKNRQNLGYTIVEVMIVLAISGVMFIIAASFISGRQQNASFTSGVRDMADQVQSISEQVNDGQFTDVALTCTAQSSLNKVTITYAPTGTGSNLGTNSPCIYLGKLMYFYTKSTSAPVENYIVFPLAGLTVNNDSPADLLGSGLTPVYSPPPGANLTTQTETSESLEVKDIKINGTITATNFGFLGSLGNQAGALTTNLIYSSAVSNPQPTPLSAYSSIKSTTVHYANSVTMCVTDGTHYATISIGDPNSSNSQLDVTIHAGLPTC
jgi:prepilin-type N-terminal cleavage/methylation domain-containing protein